VALGTPTERERGQWNFQRYAGAGEITLFDRNWYRLFSPTFDNVARKEQETARRYGYKCAPHF
jgi:polyphosphate kinase 2 (PPK2 family)